MGYDYYIACNDCRSFVALARWRIFHKLQFPPASKELFPGAGNVAAASIGGELLRERLSKLEDPFSLTQAADPKFQRLREIASRFSRDHSAHELVFINDSGDLPWAACDRYPWYEWQEVIGPYTDLKNIDLPKNLICDLNMNSWAQIEKHLLASHRYHPTVFPRDIELVKVGFEKVKRGGER